MYPAPCVFHRVNSTSCVFHFYVSLYPTSISHSVYPIPCIPLRVPLHAYPTLCIAHCLTPYSSHAVCVPLLVNFLFGYTTPCAFHFMCVLLPCVPSPVGAPPRVWAKDSTSQSGYPSMCCVKGGWIIFFVQGAVGNIKFGCSA